MSLVLHISLLLAVACLTVHHVSGHGRLFEPPGRTTVWRRYRALFEITGKPFDYNDNEKNCGGRANQINLGGKCGVCGDPWQAPVPRASEVGGRYVSATWRPIVGNYTAGQIATFVVEITANHKGWLRFKLCPVNSFSREATPRCLDQHPVQLHRESVNRRLVNGQWDRYKYYLQDNVQGKFKVKVIIPTDISCDLCVLQWEYKTGNHAGPPSVQEHFYACADVSIDGYSPDKGDLDTSPPETSTTAEPTRVTTQKSTTTTTSRPRKTRPPKTTPPKPTSPKPTPPKPTPPRRVPRRRCFAVGPWENMKHMDDWCFTRCIHHAESCPTNICSPWCKYLV